MKISPDDKEVEEVKEAGILRYGTPICHVIDYYWNVLGRPSLKKADYLLNDQGEYFEILAKYTEKQRQT